MRVDEVYQVNLREIKLDMAMLKQVIGIGCTMALAEAVGVIMYVFAPQFVSMFDRNAEVIAYGTTHGKTVALFYFLMAFSHAVAAVMRGAGKSAVPMAVVLVSWCAIRITYITVAVRLFENIQVVFLAYPITWTISAGIFLICLMRESWMRTTA